MDLTGPRPKCRPVDMLLEAAIWEGTRLRLHIDQIDRETLVNSLPMSNEQWAALAEADFDWPAPQWWMWNSNEERECNHPGWWDCPEPSLVHVHCLVSKDQELTLRYIIQDSWLPIHDTDMAKIISNIAGEQNDALVTLGQGSREGVVRISESTTPGLLKVLSLMSLSF